MSKLEIDYTGIAAEEVRDRPRLPSPAWALVFVVLTVVDLYQALAWLTASGPQRLTPELVVHVEADVAWGVLLGAVLLGGYLWLSPRGFAEGVIASVKRERPRRRGAQWVGVLFVILLYALTFVPLFFFGPEGLAARALAAAPVDLAMAACLWDLRRYHREAWKIIRHVHGETGHLLSPPLLSPEVQGLTPDQVLPHPRQVYNLPLILTLVQISLVAVGLSSLVGGAGAVDTVRLGLPLLVWIFGLWGLSVGLWGVWHERRKLRGRELEMALCAVLRERRYFPIVWWDWWGYTVILLLFGAALYGLATLPECGMRLAGGALSLGYGLGVTPLHRDYARPWALAHEIIRMVHTQGDVQIGR